MKARLILLLRLMSNIIALDIGEKRIGVARVSLSAKIPEVLEFIKVDGTEFKKIDELAIEQGAEIIVVGLPRNLDGEETQQSQTARESVEKMRKKMDYEFIFQDESLTTVKATDLINQDDAFEYKDKDSIAAAIILKDYLEREKDA